MTRLHRLLALVVCAPACAQGAAYAFAERGPATVVESVVDRLLPSVVKVHGASGLATIEPYATGIVVSDRGHVLTLDLVMLQPEHTRVVLADGSVHDAELLPPDHALGVRLLKIDAATTGVRLTPLAPAERIPANGTFVVSLGNCFRLAEFSEKLSATFGVVTAVTSTGLRYRLDEVDYDGELIITDAPNNPGHFGGGLFTLQGEWIGLNARVVESTETNTQISAAIPAPALRRYLDRWLRPGEPDVAIAPEPAEEPRTAGHHGIVLFDRGGRRSPPAYVERVERGSPAATLGLRPDDLIVRIGDRSIRTCAEFRAAMANAAPGDTVTITYKRGTDVLRGDLLLGEKR